MKQLFGLYEKDRNFFRLIGIMVVVFGLCSFLQPALFPTLPNFVAITRQFPEYGILAIAIGLTMLTGGIDLSVVSVANLSAIFAAMVMFSVAPENQGAAVIIAACLVAIIAGMVCGAFNGVMIARIGIPPILATLGTQQLFLGIAIVVTGGQSLSGMPDAFARLGRTVYGGFLPFVFIVFMVCALFVGLLLAKTSFGAKVYMLGTNEKAAAYAGLKTGWLLIKTYTISGGLAAVAGLVMMAQANAMRAGFGAAYTLQAVLVAVMGGISPRGGIGNVHGIVVAVVILQMISSTLAMFAQISNFYRDILWGAVLVFMLIINHYANKNALERQARKAPTS